MPISHVSLPVTDLKASKAFYLATLSPLGYSVFGEYGNAIGLSPPRAGPDFWMHLCPERKAGTEVQKTHVAFYASSKHKVHAFYDAAL